MKIKLALALILVITKTFSQIDAVKIASAKKAYENYDYKIALSSLGEVSQAGRKNKLFNYYKGFSHYKLNEFDSAEVYLKKYLISDINNTEAAEALADIDYKRKKQIAKESCIKSCTQCFGKGSYKVSEKTTCQICKGAGKYCMYECVIDCAREKCRGTGRVITPYGETDCTHCKGTGKCKEKKICSSCSGIGYKLKEEEITCTHPYCK